MTSKETEKYINQFPVASNERLHAIASLDLGERSEAAKRALDNRYRRKELIDKGITHEHACLIVNKENATEGG